MFVEAISPRTPMTEMPLDTLINIVKTYKISYNISICHTRCAENLHITDAKADFDNDVHDSKCLPPCSPHVPITMPFQVNWICTDAHKWT